MEKLIKSILYEIAEKTYNKKPRNFDLKIVLEERKSFHGQYWSDKKRIEIFNLSRPTEYVISTTIHELAHHIEYCEHGNLQHNKEFYKVFKELLETAIKIGYIDYDYIRNKTDSVDIKQMEKYFGKINVKYDPSMDSNKNYSLIKVFNSFNIKDSLFKLKYFYNYTEKIMQKKVHNDNIENEVKLLKEINKDIKYNIIPFNKFSINISYYIIITGDTYSHKEELKKLGYIFNGYNQKNNVWIKKINAKDLENEEIKIKSLNLSYKLKNSLTNKKHG
jgi:predicted SprT family Zn-dependent metalloprotease